jgi:hypothetical protein
MNNSKTIQKDAKKALYKLACSGAFFHILNREFGYPKETEEHAAASLCGGIMLQGYQCGMLWGAALGVGAESFRRYDDRSKAIGIAITTTGHLIESFTNRAKSVNCWDITRCDWSSKLSMVKYFLTGKVFTCNNLTGKWALEAIQAANKGLSSHEHTDLSAQTISCATEVSKKMGASDEEMIMVAGFAGGLGLSGNACGALSAAVWMKSLAWYRKNPKKLILEIPEAKKTLKAFCGATDSEFLCHQISGQRFKTIDDHTEFIKNGSCDTLMNVLARS